MKKHTLTISTLGLIALLTCGMVLYISCHKNDCKDCPQLTSEELAFICYSKGDKVVFKNDITNTFDTLLIKNKSTERIYCNSTYCGENGSIGASFTFSYLLKSGGIGIQSHNESPEISFDGPSYHSYIFPLSGNTQNITVNSITYNDIYTVQVDAATINSQGDSLKVPWKIYYSKSKGFVRFYMTNGQTWSKL